MSETRALNAALSGPVFHGAATRSALHASERHVERWAPEGPKAARSGGLRSLGFADRIAAPWMAAAMDTRGARMMAQPTTDRSTPGVNWLFPRPWFQDEIDWMAAARVRAEQTPQFLSTRGTYESARTSASDVSMPMVSSDMVSPAMASYGMPPGFAPGLAGDSNYGEVHHGLRSYSPMVPFAAAAAAEVVAGTIGLAQQSGLASVAGAAGRSPILSALAVVAPSAISPMRSAFPTQMATTSAATSAPAAVPQSTTTRALIDAARAAVTRVEDVRHAPPVGASESPVTTSESSASPTAASDSPVASNESPATYASVSEHAIADAAETSPQISRALRTVDLLLGASSSPSPTSTEPARASTFEPMAGPRVSMPAGLGGLVTALDAQHTTTHPMVRIGGMPSTIAAPFAPALAASARALEMPVARAARAAQMPTTADGSGAAPARDVPGFSPVWASPATALSSIASERARGVDHVAWSDRWLARFVGASPVALAALDVSLEHSPSPAFGATRALDVAAPEMSYLRPPMPASALAAAIRGSAQIQPIDTRAEARAAAPVQRPPASPDRALRIDDNEAVSDDIFAAIAAAAVAPRPRPPVAGAARDEAPGRPGERVAPEPRTITPSDVVRAGSRPTIADLVSIAPPPAPDAGLSPGLASSPMAPAMAAMLPLPAAPIFDTRALYPESLGTAYLGGLLSRSASPVGVVSSSPTMSALVAAAGFGAADSPMTAGAAPSLSYVGLAPAARRAAMLAASFADVASHPSALDDARAWSARDLSIAPSSLRLAEAAPERVMLAAEQTRRATRELAAPGSTSTTAAPSFAAPSFAAPSFAAPSAATPSSVDAAPSDIAASPDAATADGGAPASITTPAAAYPIESGLVGLRAALLAGGATALPLAFAEHLPMLSAAMSAPMSAAAPDVAAPSTTVAGVAPVSAAAAAAGDISLPFVTSAAAPSAMAAPAGARGLALPAVGGATTSHGPSASRFAGEPPDFGGDDAAELASLGSPGGLGALGARDSLASLISMHAPVAATSTGRPGSLAEMILSWSVAEERAVTDLSFDFVAPEMVLAAKVYGLSPGAAAQAARLAVAGPGAIASLATSVDLTFLRGFQQAHAQQGSAAQRAPFAAAGSDMPAFAGSAPTFAPDGSPLEIPGLTPTSASASTSTPSAGASPSVAGGASYDDAAAYGAGPMPSVAGSVLSSPRLPRGAFLWPEATVAALGLRALSPDGAAGMPVVALELLAAAAVADLGTWVTAFPSADQATIANVIRSMGGTVPTTTATTTSSMPGPMTSLAPSFAAAPAGSPSAATPAPGGMLADGVEAPDIDAIPGLSDSGGASRDLRARFESIYVALARTGDGQNLSPSSRAARAMALLAREDGGATSARERALAAWTMLPNVYQGGMDVVAPRDSVDDVPDEARPGLAGLAARAGESLGSFVAPSAREVSGWSSDRGASLADRVESPVYVQTAAAGSSQPAARTLMSRPGRSFAQAGGGEPEIPAWFEAAARRMLDDRSPGAGMSLAELVLVTSAATPSKSIAAATRGASSSPASAAPMTAAGGAGGGPKPDVDKLALEVYQEVLRLIDIARERSGDPYQ